MVAAGVHWSSPLLSSSEMLRILRKSDTPNLTHLELEFRADAVHDELFGHIGESYPRLFVLCMHRYRAEGSGNASVVRVPPDVACVCAAKAHLTTQERIATRLRGLVGLRLLMVHLDFEVLKDVEVFSYDYIIDDGFTFDDEELNRQRLDEGQREIAAAASVFARVLAPSLEYVCLLLPLAPQSETQWQIYRVVCDERGERVAEEMAAHHADDWMLHGYS